MQEHVAMKVATPFAQLDSDGAERSLDSLIDLVSDLLPVDTTRYPNLPTADHSEEVVFCLRHSALHFSKTAGKLAAFVEGVDHGQFAQIQVLQSIVAASLVNSLKLADEIGLSGAEIIAAMREKYDLPGQVEPQT